MLFYVLIVCTLTLPPGVNPIAVDKYIYLADEVNGGNAATSPPRMLCGKSKPQYKGEHRDVKLPSMSTHTPKAPGSNLGRWLPFWKFLVLPTETRKSPER